MNKEFLIYLVFYCKSWHVQVHGVYVHVPEWSWMTHLIASFAGKQHIAFSITRLPWVANPWLAKVWADPIWHSDLRTHTGTWSDGLIPRQFAPSSPSNKRCLPFVDPTSGKSSAKNTKLMNLSSTPTLSHRDLRSACRCLARCSAAACVQQNTLHVGWRQSIRTSECNTKGTRKHTLANAEATTILRLCDACQLLCLCKNPQSACAITVTFWQRN